MDPGSRLTRVSKAPGRAPFSNGLQRYRHANGDASCAW
jgi:hypothetical protein